MTRAFDTAWEAEDLQKMIDDGGPAFARAGAEHSQGGNFEQDGGRTS